MKLSTELIHTLLNTPNSTLKLDGYLTSWIRCYRLKRAAEAGSSLRRIQLSAKLYAFTALLLTVSISEATAKSYSVDHLLLYSHSRIINYKEFQCFNKIITKESRWDYLAKNGSHYGLGQMRSKYYRDLDPYRQIDATLKYITKRYGTNCKAWAFHEKKGYY
jgi:hypothetical protein